MNTSKMTYSAPSIYVFNTYVRLYPSSRCKPLQSVHQLKTRARAQILSIPFEVI